MNLPTEVPDCPSCGAFNWMSGFWPPALVLLRCENCKKVYKPTVPMAALTETTEPKQ